MAEPRLRRCKTQQEMERVIDDMAVQGYKIINRSDNSALIEKKSYGSVGMHVLLVLFTAGIGNIIYAVVKASNGEKIALRVNEDSE
jgi:hypothetical protein